MTSSIASLFCESELSNSKLSAGKMMYLVTGKPKFQCPGVMIHSTGFCNNFNILIFPLYMNIPLDSYSGGLY